MRMIFGAFLALALSACGSHEPDKAQPTATPATATVDNGADSMASHDPGPGEPAKVEIADSEERPVMQAQVVLDRLAFGPGVIDGKMGLSTTHALEGFQESQGLKVTGKIDDDTRATLARWSNVAATRVVRIPQDWGERTYQKIPHDPAQQAQLQSLGYESLDERLAERFHTTVDVLKQLNPNGRPAGADAGLSQGGMATAQADAEVATRPAAPAPTAGSATSPSIFSAGQLVRVPNIGADRIDPNLVQDKTWQATLASLGVGTEQPKAAKVVVDKSEGSLKAYDANDKLVAEFTVTTGSTHDPLPLGTWGITGISHNPYFNYNPKLFWDASDNASKERLPPGPNGPVGVVWIDLTKEHYGIHGTSAPETIGRTTSHGCVRLTNWDAARLAQMVDTSTKVVFQA